MHRDLKMNQNQDRIKQKVTGPQQSKRPRKTRTRSSRTKRDNHSRFGIRYLHHHMFEDGGSESKQPCPSVECKCGTSMAAVYSGKTLVALTLSVLILLIGVTFMLVGYIIPRRSVVYIERGDGTRKPLDSTATTFNTMLDDFTLVGTILISIGALLFCVVLLVPICRASNRKGEYRKAPTEETPVRKEMSSESLSSQPSDLDRRTSSGAASSTSSLQKIPVLAVVHNVQPKAQHTRSTSSLHEYRKNVNQLKDSFEEED